MVRLSDSGSVMAKSKNATVLELTGDSLTLADAEGILHGRVEALSLAPFGFGNPTPVFALFDAEIAGTPSVLKDKHLRFIVRQKGRSLPVVAWNFAERQDEVVTSARVDLACCFEQDNYSAQRGSAAWRAVVRASARASARSTCASPAAICPRIVSDIPRVPMAEIHSHRSGVWSIRLIALRE